MPPAAVEAYLAGLKRCLDEVAGQDVPGVADVLYEAWARGRRIYVCGNGGSASTASHLACDLAKAAAVDGRPRPRVQSLCDNVALLSALANDLRWEEVFSQQLRGRLDPGDVVLAISASGNSPNVLDALRYAASRSARTIGLAGFGGGQIPGLAERSIVVSSRDYGQVEDAHLALGHLLTGLLRARIAGVG